MRDLQEAVAALRQNIVALDDIESLKNHKTLGQIGTQLLSIESQLSQLETDDTKQKYNITQLTAQVKDLTDNLTEALKKENEAVAKAKKEAAALAKAKTQRDTYKNIIDEYKPQIQEIGTLRANGTLNKKNEETVKKQQTEIEELKKEKETLQQTNESLQQQITTYNTFLQATVAAIPESCKAQEQYVTDGQNKYLIQLQDSVQNIDALDKKAKGLEAENKILNEKITALETEKTKKKEEESKHKTLVESIGEFYTKYQKHLIGAVCLATLLGLIAASRTTFGMNFLSSASTHVSGWKESISDMKIFGAKNITVPQPSENLSAGQSLS